MTQGRERPLVALLGRWADSAETFARPVAAGGRLYLEAIARAGGLPVVVPPTDDPDVLEATLTRCDAVVFAGGADVNPRLYGEDRHPKVYGVDDALDRFEIAALDVVLRHDRPTLAVCRGMQVLNIAFGGTLIQHLDDTDAHRGQTHRVSLDAGSRCANAVGALACDGYSWHHQAVRDVASELTVTGRSDDGVVEAVEHEAASWMVGVQWHPEITAADDPAQQALFDELIRRAATD